MKMTKIRKIERSPSRLLETSLSLDTLTVVLCVRLRLSH